MIQAQDAEQKLRWDTLRRPSVFLLAFIGSYVMLEWLYGLVPDSVLRSTVYPHVVIRPLVWLIDAALGIRVNTITGYDVVGPHVGMVVVRGCDGSGMLILLTAAVVAYPAALWSKGRGLLLGTALTYVANELRLLTLCWVMRYHGAWFDYAHVYLLPSLLIVGCVVFFSFWAASAGGGRVPARAD